MTETGQRKTVRGYVLAGGGSTRFGRDKALVEIGAQPMLLRMHKLLDGVAEEVGVIAAPEKYASLGLKCIADLWPGEGPLGGIVTALLHTEETDPKSAWNLVLSCDMPFLTPDWLEFLATRATKSAAQVILPFSAGGPEPLCACWRTDAARTLRAAFESGIRKVTDGVALLRSEVLDEADWKRFDSAERLFWNMNTAADFEEVRRIWEAERA